MTQALQDKIARIKKQIQELGPLHPGRITEQYNVCGTPGCRCKDPNNPRKHGPYANLSYTFEGQSKTRFVRKDCVAEMKRRTQRYGHLKKLVAELVAANIELAQQEVLRREGSR